MPARSASTATRERRQRRLLGGLQHHRAAGRQRRRGLARDHRGREVPRRDAGDDADRLRTTTMRRSGQRATGSCRRRRAWPPRRTTRGTTRAYSISPRASASGLPCSARHQRGQLVDRFRASDRTSGAGCGRGRWRCARATPAGRASAAAIARRVSAAPIRGAVPTSSPVAGSWTSNRRAVVGFDPRAVDETAITEEVQVAERRGHPEKLVGLPYPCKRSRSHLL